MIKILSDSTNVETVVAKVTSDVYEGRLYQLGDLLATPNNNAKAGDEVVFIFKAKIAEVDCLNQNFSVGESVYVDLDNLNNPTFSKSAGSFTNSKFAGYVYKSRNTNEPLKLKIVFIGM